MKIVLVMLLTASLLLSFSVLVSADILFGASAEAGSANFSAVYANSTTVSKTPTILFVDGNLNLLGTNIRLEYGTADMSQYTYSSADVKVGWDFGLPILKAGVFGEYQAVVFTTSGVPNTYTGIMGGVRVESKIDKFTFYGSASLPLKTYNNGLEDNNATMNDFSFGVGYAPLPLMDLYLTYRNTTANSSIVNITNQNYSIGAKISF